MRCRDVRIAEQKWTAGRPLPWKWPKISFSQHSSRFLYGTSLTCFFAETIFARSLTERHSVLHDRPKAGAVLKNLAVASAGRLSRRHYTLGRMRMNTGEGRVNRGGYGRVALEAAHTAAHLRAS